MIKKWLEARKARKLRYIKILEDLDNLEYNTKMEYLESIKIRENCIDKLY